MHRPKQKRKFSFDQYCALSFGNNFFGHIGPVFETDEDYQVAWLLHRDEVLTSNPGRRPAAWWQLEAPVGLKKPSYSGDETILLYERGLLTKDEIDQLMPFWREWYNKAQAPDYSYYASGGKWLDGDEARKARYRWAGMPTDIVKRFDADRAMVLPPGRPL
jgi:hypothetical protein